MHYFLAGTIAGVLDVCVYGDAGTLCGKRIKGNGKICITQTVTKGECGVDAETVKVAVTYIDTLFVVFVFKIAIEITVIPGKGDVIVLSCPGVGKLSGRRDRAA